MAKIKECPNCKTMNEEQANFCTMCGFPLSQDASVLFKQRKTTAQLELINSLTDEIDDIATLKLLKTKAEKLSK